MGVKLDSYGYIDWDGTTDIYDNTAPCYGVISSGAIVRGIPILVTLHLLRGVQTC